MIGAVQDVPRCFGCEEPVTHDAVYAAPLCEHETCPTAVFHPLCLMEWREHAAERLEQFRAARAAFLRHVNGECECPPEDE